MFFKEYIGILLDFFDFSISFFLGQQEEKEKYLQILKSTDSVIALGLKTVKKFFMGVLPPS